MCVLNRTDTEKFRDLISAHVLVRRNTLIDRQIDTTINQAKETEKTQEKKKRQKKKKKKKKEKKNKKKPTNNGKD
jgi:hypothetical protein